MSQTDSKAACVRLSECSTESSGRAVPAICSATTHVFIGPRQPTNVTLERPIPGAASSSNTSKSPCTNCPTYRAYQTNSDHTLLAAALHQRRLLLIPGGRGEITTEWCSCSDSSAAPSSSSGIPVTDSVCCSFCPFQMLGCAGQDPTKPLVTYSRRSCRSWSQSSAQSEKSRSHCNQWLT